MPLSLLLVSFAWAEDPPPEASSFVLLLDQARAELLVKDWAGARLAIDQAQAVAPANDVLVLAKDLGRVDFYRGVIEWRVGDRNKAALDAWRRAAVLAPEFQPDPVLLPDTEEQDAFYAIVSEVKGYPEVELALPDDPGGATIFIDGQTRDVGDFLVSGTHYVQIRCDDGSLVGSWYTLGAPPPDWLAPCSGGSYPTKGRTVKRPKETPIKPEKEPAVADKAVADKAVADKAVADKAVTDKALAEKAAIAARQAADKVAAAQAALDRAATTKLPPTSPPPTDTTSATSPTLPVTAEGDPAHTERSKAGFGGVAWSLVAAGGALLAGGAAYDLLVFEPLYGQGQTAIADPTTISAGDADSLSQRYDSARFTALGLLGGGALVVSSGVIVGAVDAHLYVGPGRLGLVGTW